MNLRRFISTVAILVLFSFYAGDLAAIAPSSSLPGEPSAGLGPEQRDLLRNLQDAIDSPYLIERDVRDFYRIGDFLDYIERWELGSVNPDKRVKAVIDMIRWRNACIPYPHHIRRVRSLIETFLQQETSEQIKTAVGEFLKNWQPVGEYLDYLEIHLSPKLDTIPERGLHELNEFFDQQETYLRDGDLFDRAKATMDIIENTSVFARDPELLQRVGTILHHQQEIEDRFIREGTQEGRPIQERIARFLETWNPLVAYVRHLRMKLSSVPLDYYESVELSKYPSQIQGHLKEAQSQFKEEDPFKRALAVFILNQYASHPYIFPEQSRLAIEILQKQLELERVSAIKEWIRQTIIGLEGREKSIREYIQWLQKQKIYGEWRLNLLGIEDTLAEIGRALQSPDPHRRAHAIKRLLELTQMIPDEPMMEQAASLRRKALEDSAYEIEGEYVEAVLDWQWELLAKAIANLRSHLEREELGAIKRWAEGINWPSNRKIWGEHLVAKALAETREEVKEISPKVREWTNSWVERVKTELRENNEITAIDIANKYGVSFGAVYKALRLANTSFKKLKAAVQGKEEQSHTTDELPHQEPVSPWQGLSDAKVELAAIVADIDRTLTLTGTADLQGANLQQILRALLKGKKVILISGSPYHPSYAGLDFSREAIQRRVVEIIRQELAKIEQVPKMRNLRVRYISGKGTVTFDSLGKESIKEEKEKIIPKNIELEVGRAFIEAFIILQKGLTLEQLRQTNSNLEKMIWRTFSLERLAEIARRETGINDLRFWPFGSELALVFHDEMAPRGDQIQLLAQRLLEENGIQLDNEKFFFSGGGSFVKVAMIRKQDIIEAELNRIKGKGAVVAIGDSNTDDFLRIRKRGYFPFYLGSAFDMINYPHVIVARDTNGQDNVQANGFGPIVEGFINAEELHRTYEHLYESPIVGGRYSIRQLVEEKGVQFDWVSIPPMSQDVIGQNL